MPLLCSFQLTTPNSSTPNFSLGSEPPNRTAPLGPLSQDATYTPARDLNPLRGAGFRTRGEPASSRSIRWVAGSDPPSLLAELRRTRRRELYYGRRKPESKECRRPEKIGKIEIREQNPPRWILLSQRAFQRQKTTPARTLQGGLNHHFVSDFLLSDSGKKVWL